MPDFNGRRGRTSHPEDANSAASKVSQEIQKRVAAQGRAKKKIRGPERFADPLCHTCQHPHRDWLEYQMVRGVPYKTLGDRVQPEIDRRSLSNHHKKHMDLEDAALRHIIEREAQLQGMDIEEGVQDLVSTRSVLEVALRKGYKSILDGETVVEARDLVQIAKTLGDMNDKQTSAGLDELRQQMAMFIQAIKAVTDQETQQAIADEVARLRKRQNLVTPYESDMAPEMPPAIAATVVDAEVID